jgi:dolichyl-phosphate-mannose--protein O-mannosyl transferase
MSADEVRRVKRASTVAWLLLAVFGFALGATFQTQWRGVVFTAWLVALAFYVRVLSAGKRRR